MTGRTGPARSRTNLRHEFDMRYDEETRKAIYAKTNGLCHLCWKPIAFSNYGAHGTRGAWEVDHSVPVSEGGTDHLNNLFSSHTACNRSKQAASSLSAPRGPRQTPPPRAAPRGPTGPLGKTPTSPLPPGPSRPHLWPAARISVPA